MSPRRVCSTKIQVFVTASWLLSVRENVIEDTSIFKVPNCVYISPSGHCMRVSVFTSAV
jgi:hypothetical protein